MTHNKNCPDDKEWIRLINEQVSADQEVQLVEHADQCMTCQQKLDTLSAESQIFEGCDNKEFSEQVIRNIELNSINLDSEQAEPVVLQETLKALEKVSPASGSSNSVFDLIESSFNEAESGLRLVERIGQGGMGVVFKAEDVVLKRFVAIKFMSPVFDGDKQTHARFIREARAAAGAKHPHIVTIHSVCDRKPYPYLTMEYVDGDSLQCLVEGERIQGVNQLVQIGCQMAEALSAAHAVQVIHRDIKPENILIESRTNQVKITDFGLARVMDEAQLTQTGVFMGSPGFQAPEILEGTSQVDHRCDLFSLGCVLYYMCSGRPPFQSDSLVTALQMARRAEYEPLLNLVADVPQALAELIDQLLRPDPKQRTPTAEEVRKKLEAIRHAPARSGEIAPPPVQPASKIVVQKSRPKQNASYERLAYAGITTLVILIVGLVLWATWPRAESDTSNSTSRLADGTKRNSATEEKEVQKKVQGSNRPEGNKVLSSKQIRTRQEDNSLAKVAPVFILKSAQDSTAFNTLQEAVASAERGDTILVDTDEPVSVFETIEVAENVRLVAAAGRQPIFDVYLSSGEEDDEPQAFLQVEKDLYLSGIEIRLHHVEEEDTVLIRVESGNLQLEDCRLRADGEATCIGSDSGANVAMENCELFFGAGCGLELFSEQQNETRLANCLLIGNVGMRIESEAPHSIELDRCTTLCERWMELRGERLDDRQRPIFEVRSTRNVLATSECVLAMDEEYAAPEELKSWVKWIGEGNLFVRPRVCFFEEDEEYGRTPVWCRDLNGWEKIFTEIDPVVAASPFGLTEQQLRELVEDSSHLKATAFRLKADLAMPIGYSFNALPANK